jgi:dsDNA-binding SOS-regulon protein
MDILSSYFENYNKNMLSSNDDSINFDVLLENKEIKKRLNNSSVINDNNISIFGYKYKPLYRRFKEYLDNKYETMGYIKKKNVLKILNAEYVIFLSDKFFSKFTKHKVLKYFDKYDILYLNYHKKDEVLEILNLINLFIKSGNEKEKKDFLGAIPNSKIKKLKINYFLENNIELNTLYKKISFSNEEIFISFDNYIFKKMEYKLRVFCQIAEKLGANVINIEYDSKFSNNFDASISTSVGGGVDVGASVKNKNKNNGKINLTFSYSNFYYNLNLNKFYIYDIIKDEEKFFITSDDFNTDIDLKFLIDARCINLIEKYNTNIIVNRVNEMERKIFSKVQNYGINMNYSNNKTDYVNIKIGIEFLDIYTQPKCIIGNNIYVLKEGYKQLVNIINEDINIDKKSNNDKKDNDKEDIVESRYYRKIFFFLKNHINYMCKKYIVYDDYKDVSKIKQYFDDIIMLNFTELERDELFYDYFNIKNNVIYKDFIDFRNILLLGNASDKIDKFTFISYQYHLYKRETEYLKTFITKYVGEAYDKLLNIYKDNYIEKIVNEKNNENKNEKNNLDIILSKKYNYLLDITNKIDNSYLPYYDNGIIINSFGDLNKMLVENKKDICLLVEKLFDSLLKTNIFIDFDIEDKNSNINNNLFNLVFDYFFVEYLEFQLKCSNTNFNGILLNIFMMTNVFINDNMYEICMKNPYKNKYINGIDITEWIPSKKVEYYFYKLIKKDIIELYDINVFDKIFDLLKIVLIEKELYKPDNYYNITKKYNYFREIFNMRDLFHENHVSINYNKYKILFTWNDYLKIKKYLIYLYESSIDCKDDELKVPSENKNECICGDKNDGLDAKNIELDVENNECKNDDK